MAYRRSSNMCATILLTMLFTFILAVVGVNESVGGDKIVLRCAVVNAPKTYKVRALVWALDRMEEYTNGKVQIKLIHSAQLGGEREYLEGHVAGSIDISMVATAAASSFCKEYEILSLPFLFRNTAHVMAATQGPIAERLLKMLEKKGIKGLGIYDQGFQNIHNRLRPIRNLNDLKGMKIRVMESNVYIDTMKALGARATPMSYAQLFSALEQGIVDGSTHAPNIYLGSSLYEVDPYYCLSSHVRNFNIIAMSLKTWNRLPKDAQNGIMKAARVSHAIMEQKVVCRGKYESLEVLKKRGVTITEITDRDSWVKRVLPIHEKYAKTLGPVAAELIKGIKELDRGPRYD